jgi:hypothetical protein
MMVERVNERFITGLKILVRACAKGALPVLLWGDYVLRADCPESVVSGLGTELSCLPLSQT